MGMVFTSKLVNMGWLRRWTVSCRFGVCCL